MDELPLLLAWVGEADVIAGYRKQRRDPLPRKINAWGWNRLVRLLFYVPVRDIDCAFKLFRRDVAQQPDDREPGRAHQHRNHGTIARSGCRIVEVGVTHLPRTAGEPSGANLRVIAACGSAKVGRMYGPLSQLGPASGTRGLRRKALSACRHQPTWWFEFRAATRCMGTDDAVAADRLPPSA